MLFTRPLQLPDVDGVIRAWPFASADIRIIHSVEPSGPRDIAQILITPCRIQDGQVILNPAFAMQMSFSVAAGDPVSDPVLAEEASSIAKSIEKLLRSRGV